MSGKKIAAIGIIGAAALGAILIATKPPVKEVTPPPVQQCSSTSHCPTNIGEPLIGSMRSLSHYVLFPV